MTTNDPALVLPAELLLSAYRSGIFPMAHEDGEIYWHQPDPRAVFDLVSLKPDGRTARVMRSGRFSSTKDQAFEQVMRSCADRAETWIDDRILTSYAELHRTAHAHSVEVWEEGHLVGGIYGVALGAAFFGESMFGKDNAGKVAFHLLATHLQERGFLLFDTQYINTFTRQLGAYEIPKAEFEKALATAIDSPVRF
jgi:leucyl/phenylalanyl-tRNA---protein transferase